MVLDIRPLISGLQSVIHIDYTLSTDFADGLPISLAGVKFPQGAQITGDISDRAGYIRLSVCVTLPYETMCARCASDVSGVFEFDFERTAVNEGTLQDEIDENDEYVVYKDGMLDIDDELREMIIVSFPTKILCDDDCKGICQNCGKNLNAGECGCDTREIDPRLAPLLKLLENEDK